MLENIFVDCDSINSLVLKFLKDFSQKQKIQLNLISKKSFKALLNESEINVVIVFDVDSYILTNSNKHSLVITRDRDLAYKLINRDVKVINDEGKLYNKTLIKYLILKKNITKSLNINKNVKRDNKRERVILEKFKKTIKSLF